MLLLLLLIVASDIWISQELHDDTQLVARSLEIENKISNLALEIRRAESSQRGYILSLQEDYLEDFRRYMRAIPAQIADLQDSVYEIDRRRQQLEQLLPVINQKLNELRTSIDLAIAGRTDDARDLMRTGEGRRAMQSIATMLEDMRAAEENLLADRRRETQRTNNLSLAVTLVGAFFIVAFGILSILLLRRTGKQREEARRALEGMNANLEETVAERTADLREANNEIQRFAYIVSHDLRSPLVNIMGFTTELEALRKDMFERLAELRRDGDADEKAKDETLGQDFDEAIDFIKTSIGKMDRLINSILKLSREGRREFRPEFINMHELFQSIANGQAHKAAELGAEIDIAAMPPAYTDRLAVEQIFSNLVDNALKYLQDGRPGRISIRGRSTPTTNIYEVDDNGRGIAPEDHQRIFDLFRRAGTQDRPGEGIGLAHVRALVRRLGGQMQLRSKLGEGSTFVVMLPQRWMGEQRIEERTVA
jgi:signal transduction histidine kinase